MTIQPLNLADRDTAEELWALQHAAYRHEALLIGAADLPPLRDTVASLQACGETFFGCRAEDGELAGAVAIETDTDAAEVTVSRMMVHPDRFRRGIGSLLLQHVFASFPAGTAFAVTAEVRNEPALRLYAKHGFEPAERLQPAPGFEMVRMRKRA